MPGVAISLLLSVATIAPLVEGPPEALHTGAGWRVALLPRQSKPATHFVAERVDDRPAMRIDAQASYGNLLLELPHGPAAAPTPPPQRLHWAWRMQTPNPGTNLRTRAGDDVAARVCLSFDLPMEALHFEDRVALQLARAISGQPLPSATVCWVWGHAEAHGAHLHSPYTGRVRYVVLRNAADAPGSWFEEHRDIAADFLRAFGDETQTVPPVIAVLLGGDADNTGAHSVAHVAALRFEP